MGERVRPLAGTAGASRTSAPLTGTGITWPPELPFHVVLAQARVLHPSAISHLYRRFLPVVYRYTLARIGDVHTAEDVTSETFMAVVEGIHNTRAEDELGFAAWVLGIARNKVALHFRKARTRTEGQLGLEEDRHPHATADSGDPLDVITVRESWSEVVAALNLLTEEQRTVVLYRCVLGYSTEDVARLMDKRSGTIRALQFRALASLARHLADGPTQTVNDDRLGRASDATRR